MAKEFLPNAPEVPVEFKNEYYWKEWMSHVWQAQRRNSLVSVVRTAAFTANLDEYYYPCDTTGGAFAVTLPPAAGNMGKQIVIYHKTNANALTIAFTAGGDVLSPTAVTPIALGDTVELTSDGISTWYARASASGSGPTNTIDIQDEGTPLGSFDTINFKNAGVTATDAGGGTADVDVPGGSGGITKLDFFWGSQRDGAFTFDGATTPAFASRSGSTYILVRNVHGTTITVDAGVSVNMGGYAIFCTSLVCNGHIHDDGASATGSSAGASVHTTHYTGVGNGGVSGGVGSQNGGSVAVHVGLAGGKGGRGGDANSGGFVGGTITNQTFLDDFPSGFTSVGGLNGLYTLMGMRGIFFTSTTQGIVQGGGAGSGGGSVLGSSGGGGGEGGGVVQIFAKVISGSGSITCDGGNGGNAVWSTVLTDAGGGGGGGGGGLIQIWTTTTGVAAILTIHATKGNGGTKTGLGSNGANGVDGTVIYYFIES